MLCWNAVKWAPESTKKLKLFFVSWRKIKFFAARKDMAVADAGAIARGGGGSAGLSRAGGGGVGADRRPTSFLDMSSPS